MFYQQQPDAYTKENEEKIKTDPIRFYNYKKDKDRVVLNNTLFTSIICFMTKTRGKMNQIGKNL